MHAVVPSVAFFPSICMSQLIQHVSATYRTERCKKAKRTAAERPNKRDELEGARPYQGVNLLPAEGKSLKEFKMAHGHSHGSACCHDHDHDSEDPAVLYTLHQKVIMVASRLPFLYSWYEIYILLGPIVIFT